MFEWRYYGFILFGRKASDGSWLPPFSQVMRRRDQHGAWEYRALTTDQEEKEWAASQW
jgi:hypothetical protein